MATLPTTLFVPSAVWLQCSYGSPHTGQGFPPRWSRSLIFIHNSRFDESYRLDRRPARRDPFELVLHHLDCLLTLICLYPQ